MAALDFRDTVHTSPDEYSPQPFDLYDDDDVPPTDLTDNYEHPSVRENHSETDSYNADTVNSSAASYCALSPSQSFRSAISATFRGYCSELFVYGKCSKRDAGCAMDHSSAAQERCINSFALLSKRELSRHADLPSWQPLSTSSSKYNSTAPYSDARSLRPQPSFIQPRTYGNSGGSVNHTTPSRPYLK